MTCRRRNVHVDTIFHCISGTCSCYSCSKLRADSHRSSHPGKMFRLGHLRPSAQSVAAFASARASNEAPLCHMLVSHQQLQEGFDKANLHRRSDFFSGNSRNSCIMFCTLCASTGGPDVHACMAAHGCHRHLQLRDQPLLPQCAVCFKAE